MMLFSLLIAVAGHAVAAQPPLKAKRIIVIDKAKQNLVLLVDGKPRATFPASFGIDPDSDKSRAFDCATPEGLYRITHHNAQSRFHRFLGISYPNLADAEKGLAEGVISLEKYRGFHEAIAHKSMPPPRDTGLGSGIGIHGGGVFRLFGKTRERDWTEGCIAVDDKNVEKLFDFCKPGDPVIIFNSRRSLYGIIRPFARSKTIDERGVPVCPDGVCTYQAAVPTRAGEMILTLMEGKEHGRSIEVTVHDTGAGPEPSLVLVDGNADGYMSLLDSIVGPGADRYTPDAAYQMVREALIEALSTGRLCDTGDKR